jgi:hypothetical protein
MAAPICWMLCIPHHAAAKKPPGIRCGRGRRIQPLAGQQVHEPAEDLLHVHRRSRQERPRLYREGRDHPGVDEQP